MGIALDPARLWDALKAVYPSRDRIQCAVAWSGGLDSTVLMHLMVGLRRRHPRQIGLRAVHVDHHLQPASAAFRAQCRKLARRWRVPLDILDVRVKSDPGVSLEEAAREARHAAWKETLEPGEILLAAQHADDQLETLLLALMRGAGPAGLCGMPHAAALGRGRLVRPLLELPRRVLQEYAGLHDLSWVEDPTNQELRFDRNYLRGEVVPRLRQRWPAVALTASRSARHCGTLVAALNAATANDLDSAADGAGLEMAVLRRWAAPRQLAVLRAWFARAGLRSPETRHLEQVLLMLKARRDAHPMLVLPEATVQVHEARLLLDVAQLAATTPQRPRSWRWRGKELKLPAGELVVRQDEQGDLDLSRLPGVLTVHSPATAPGRGRSLRKLLQELSVPLRERERLPLIYAGADSRPLAIGDLWLRPDLQARAGSRQRGRIVWRPQP